MALTYSIMSQLLTERLDAWYTAAGVTTMTYLDACATALRVCGYPNASPISAPDAELAAVVDADVEKFLLVAEIRAKQNFLSNLASVDTVQGSGSMRLSQLADRIQKNIESLEKKLATQYGIGLGTLTAGLIDLNFVETL